MSTLNTKVSELYVAMFGRAPDAGGLAYWVGSLESGEVSGISAIAQQMYATPNARPYYPLDASNTQVITSFYKNVLGRNPDADGLAYWEGQMAGGTTFGSLVGQMIQAVREYSGTDQDGLVSQKLFDNRVDVSEMYANLGGDPDGATSALAGVTEKSSSVSDKLGSLAQSRFDALRASSAVADYSGQDDEIDGTNGSDAINGGDGYDTIKGLGGNDILIGGSGDDKLYGGYGQDFLEGGTGADLLYAGSYSSKEYVPSSYVNGEYVSGYYIITPDAHAEILNGGGGDDKLYGGYGRDTLLGGDGADYIVGDEDGALWLNNSRFLASGFEGRLYNDVIDGGAGADRILAGPGDDVITGGSGDDTIYGGEGADFIDGGSGDDRIYANDSGFYRGDDWADEIYGGEGDDSIYALTGSDSADGGDGDDTIYYSRTEQGGFGVITAGEGEDEIYINIDGTRATDRVLVDLSEKVSKADTVTIDTDGRVGSPVEIRSFELGTDGIDVSGSFTVFGSDQYSYSSNSQQFSYNGDLRTNYVQIVKDTSTPWDLPADQYDYNDPDSSGKGVFIIQGASSITASAADAAEIIDLYGNNATYGDRKAHYFLLDVEDVGVGIYRFKDDTGSDNRVVTDEITPVALLAGVYTDDFNLGNGDFLV